jgi:peroxiredoxin
MNTGVRRTVAGAVAALVLAVGARAQVVKSTFDEEFEKARTLLSRREYFEALKGFQKANQLAGGTSAACFVSMAQAMVGMKTWANVVETAQRGIDLAGSDARLLARAHTYRGLAFQALAEKDNEPAKLRDAEAEFRAALVADPESILADLYYNLGVVLMKQMRDEEGIAELKKEIAIRANGTTADESRSLIANPRRAREKYAPDFSLVSTAGEKFTVESLRGKVVLLDFWGTWCAPCVRAVPSLRKLQNEHAKDAFLILGVSSDPDKDEPKWRTFIEKNGMVWPQYRDRGRDVLSAFGVHAFPTYVLLDAEGIERFRVSGTGFHESRALGAAIEQQLKR